MSEAKPIHGVPVELLKKWHRDLDACQKVIWLSGCRPQVPGGFDPAYVTDAQHSLREIEATIATTGEIQRPAAWEYRNTNMGNELSYTCLNHYYRPKYGGEEHEYVQGVPLYRRPFNTAELLLMLDLLGGVCDKAQKLIDSRAATAMDVTEAMQALEISLHDCGWQAHLDRAKGLLK